MSSILAVSCAGRDVSKASDPMVITLRIRAEIVNQIYHPTPPLFQGFLIIPRKEEDCKEKLTMIR